MTMKAKRHKHLKARVLAELGKGPATSRDIEDATGIPVRQVSTTLNELRERGDVTRRGKVGYEEGGHWGYIWMVKGHSK